MSGQKERMKKNLESAKLLSDLRRNFLDLPSNHSCVGFEWELDGKIGIFSMDFWLWRRAREEEEIIVFEEEINRWESEDETIPRPIHISALSGDMYVREILEGHPERCRREFRMEPYIFQALVNQLRERNYLRNTRNVTVEEQVGIFIFILGRAGVVRLATERFQHSNETVSRHFNNVLHAITRLCRDYIRMPPTATPAKISGNPKWYPYFKDCIGAIDGTHVPITIPESEAEPYRNRKQTLSQNVMVACDFDLKFIYVRAGFEGSASDAKVLQRSLEHGFTVPRNKFYLVDAGYANTPNFIAPYRSTRYHLQDFGPSRSRPANYKELFNRRHSSLRSHIERIIGILKKRFPILKVATHYPIDSQTDIIVACCVLHNFIRNHNEDSTWLTNEISEELIVDVPAGDEGYTEDVQDMNNERSAGAIVRDHIAEQMWRDYCSEELEKIYNC